MKEDKTGPLGGLAALVGNRALLFTFVGVHAAYSGYVMWLAYVCVPNPLRAFVLGVPALLPVLYLLSMRDAYRSLIGAAVVDRYGNIRGQTQDKGKNEDQGSPD